MVPVPLYHSGPGPRIFKFYWASIWDCCVPAGILLFQIQGKGRCIGNGLLIEEGFCDGMIFVRLCVFERLPRSGSRCYCYYSDILTACTLMKWQFSLLALSLNKYLAHYLFSIRIYRDRIIWWCFQCRGIFVDIRILEQCLFLITFVWTFCRFL